MKLANPVPLGLIAFAATSWLLSMFSAGWLPGTGLGLLLALAFALGGSAQMIAGVLAFSRGDAFGMVAFTSYGVFWWSLALFVHFLASGVSGAFVGTYLFVWGVFSLYLWLATFGAPRLTQLVFLALWITLVLLAIGNWTASALVTHLGGYIGLIAALLAACASVINRTRGHELRPVGVTELSR